MSVHPSQKSGIEKVCSKTCKLPVAIVLDRSVPEHIVLSWRVSRIALDKLAPVGPSSIIHLELRFNLNQPIQVVLLDPKTKAQRVIDLPAAHAPAVITQTPLGLHIESPMLHAHLQLTDTDSYKLLYIRTDLFTRLNVAGGRYQPTDPRVNSIK